MIVVEPKANADMKEGYMDGFDLNSPTPSTNRSRSYRHGFMVGRADKTGKSAGHYDELVRKADQAMALDYADNNRLLE
jgi:hypothetical protein